MAKTNITNIFIYDQGARIIQKFLKLKKIMRRTQQLIRQL